MTALYALTHLIIGPSSESRCLCTYTAIMDAHAHGGQSIKLMCRYSKAGCTQLREQMPVHLQKHSWTPMHMVQAGSP